MTSGVELGVLSSATEDAQAEPGEETSESTATGNESQDQGALSVSSDKLKTESGSWHEGYLRSIMECTEGSPVDDSDAAALMQQIDKLAKELAAKDSKHLQELKTMISMMDDSS